MRKQSKEEVRPAVKGMKSVKAAVEVCPGERAVDLITRRFNIIPDSDDDARVLSFVIFVVLSYLLEV